MARTANPKTWEWYCVVEREFASGIRQSALASKHNISRDYVRQIVHKVREAAKQRMAAQSNPAQDFAPVMRSVPIVREPPRVETPPKPVGAPFRMGCMSGGDPLAEVRARQVRKARLGRI
jgi:hypothetical protein